jgi:predicted pyridoxine 5'-phosphate oxidase superfamily flavin-nucleotide-binding protein
MSSTRKPEVLGRWPHAEPAFHAGERALQQRLGLDTRLEQVGRQVMRARMPDEHREFFAELPLLLLGSVDDHDRPWASALVGPPGFVASPQPSSLRVDVPIARGEPLAERLTVGAYVGLLGLQFETRRRNRANGKVTAVDDGGFSVEVAQSFGNCPKYIHPRHLVWSDLAEQAGGSTGLQERDGVSLEGAHLSPAAVALIAASDTFFIASATPRSHDPGDPARGVDVSHRGGPAGFVQVESGALGHLLSVPDYQGNFFFNTLGNLLLSPRAGLLFLDFATGHALELSGTTEVLWDAPAESMPLGAQRMVRFAVEAGRYVRRPWPLVCAPLSAQPR